MEIGDGCGGKVGDNREGKRDRERERERERGGKGGGRREGGVGRRKVTW